MFTQQTNSNRCKLRSLQTGGPAVSETMISKNILNEELSSLQFSHLVEVKREVIEGTKHHGMAAVVQSIASAP